MSGFGTIVNIGIKTENNTGLLKHIFFDNRKLSISEKISIDGIDGDKLEIEPIGKIKNIGNGVFQQKFLINQTKITRELSFSSDMKDIWGSRFNLVVKLPEKRSFNLRWSILIKNPDFVFAESKKHGKSAVPTVLREGVFTINSQSATYLRIEEIDGVNIALPLILESNHDFYEYSFNREKGLCFTYGRKATSKISKIKIEGYLSIKRMDEPIPDNSLILIDKDDWKSAIRSCAFPLKKEKLEDIFESSPLFDQHNQFPMIFSDIDSKDTIKEFTRLGQAIKILKSDSISRKNKYYNSAPFKDTIIENPSFRWSSKRKNFRFMLLLPDNLALAVSVALLIRDLNILPIFFEDLENETLLDYSKRCLEKKVLVLCTKLEDRHKEFFKSLKIKIYECLLGNNEKASIKLFKTSTILRLLDRIKWYEIFVEKNISEAKRNSTLRRINQYIQDEINRLPTEVKKLTEIKQCTQLLIELLRFDYYPKIVNSLKMIIGLDGIHFLSSLKVRENKSVSKLRRVSIVSQNIRPSDVVSLIQYSLAFDTPAIVVDEEKHLKQELKVVKEIITRLEEDKPIIDLTDRLAKHLKNCPSISFLQSWSDFDYHLTYSNSIIKNLSVTQLIDNEKADKHLYSTKGAVSLFLKSDFPIEFGLGKESISGYTFGRFFINNSVAFRHQIISALQQPRRTSDVRLKFVVITIEKDKRLIEYNKKIREVLRCYGDTFEAIGELSKNELYKGFKIADLVFLFAHGDIGRISHDISVRNQTLRSKDISKKDLFRGFLIMNSCNTGKDYSGKKKGITSSLSKLGFPLIIAPLHEVSFRATALFSMSVAKKLFYRISLSQIITFTKREAIDSSQFEQTSYLIFGSPYTRFYNPNLTHKNATIQCIEDIHNKF